ncbi:unnamed protein product [Polarella glacialis]|uniref:Helicase ATP-binding domain-containing protein n=3 Tax=Polarella glacialis TaxID=89957 RepID=A0A813E9S2_POLGL|nr:unnamed protein product [Polarella glacialis]
MDEAARGLLEAQLASLLELELPVARSALERCGYDLESAVGIAYEIQAGGGALHPAPQPQQQRDAPLPASLRVDQRAGVDVLSHQSAPSLLAQADITFEDGHFSPGSLLEPPSASSSSSSSGPSAPSVQPQPALNGPSASVSSSSSGRPSSASRPDYAQQAALLRASQLARLRIAELVAQMEQRVPQAPGVHQPDLLVARPQKRARTEISFSLKDNSADEAADNPPAFQEYALREEQRRSLAWMLRQEARGEADGMSGGLLADKMGYGKTSTTIGLISLDDPGRGEVEAAMPAGYLRSKATLIVCPARLLRQWEGEFVKFLGDSGCQIWYVEHAVPAPLYRSCLLKQKRGTGDLRILVLETCRDLCAITYKEYMEGFDVVLASVTLQSQENYRRCIDLMCSYLPKGTRRFPTELNGMFMALRLKRLREVMKRVLARKDLPNFQELFTAPEIKTFANYKGAKFPVFELFWWHRVVFDEFHESESWEYRVRELTKALGATNRWGLSGTPPLGSSEAVADVAELMGYPDLCGAAYMKRHVEIGNKPHKLSREECSSDSHQTALRLEAQEFVDGYVRQNSSELVEAIRVVEHTELVEHTPEERIIYRQACHDNGIFDLSQSDSAIQNVCVGLWSVVGSGSFCHRLRFCKAESSAAFILCCRTCFWKSLTR